jgi:hypothetical protein
MLAPVTVVVMMIVVGRHAILRRRSGADPLALA